MVASGKRRQARFILIKLKADCESRKKSLRLCAFARFIFSRQDAKTQRDDEDKQTVFHIIDKMLTTKKFKDFFQKNIAVL